MKHGVTVSIGVQSLETPSAQLTDFLGLQPDESWDAGSPTLIAGNVHSRRYNDWCLVERVASLEDASDAVDRVICRVRPIRDRLRQLPRGSETYLLVTVTTSDSVFGFGLSAEQVQFCESIGAALEMSFVVDSPGRGPTGSESNDDVA
jgi:hypothetical protein